MGCKWPHDRQCTAQRSLFIGGDGITIGSILPPVRIKSTSGYPLWSKSSMENHLIFLIQRKKKHYGWKTAFKKHYGCTAFLRFSRFLPKGTIRDIHPKMMKLEGRILLCHLIDRVEIWRKSIYTHHWIDYWKKFTKFWNIATVSSLVAILKMFISLLLFEINDEYI